MTALEQMRDHARRMATAKHTDECEGHAPTHWGWAKALRPDPTCPGCVSDHDRELWAQQADELDRYLAGQAEEGLFE